MGSRTFRRQNHLRRHILCQQIQVLFATYLFVYLFIFSPLLTIKSNVKSGDCFFPGKTEHFYWLRTKKLCWEACAVSFYFLFFSAAPWLFSAGLKLLLDFLSSSKNVPNSNVLNTLPERDISRALFFQIYTTLQSPYFLWRGQILPECIYNSLYSKGVPAAVQLKGKHFWKPHCHKEV